MLFSLSGPSCSKLPTLFQKKYYHTCQVLGKSKSETVRVILIFVYNLVIDPSEKPGAQVLRVRFFSLFNRHNLLTQREISNTVLSYPYHLL